MDRRTDDDPIAVRPVTGEDNSRRTEWAERDGEINESFLLIALSWARTRAIQRYVDAGDDLDPEEMQSRVEAVRDELGRISNAKRKCIEMQSTADDVKGLLDELRDDVTVELDGITTELSKASDGV